MGKYIIKRLLQLIPVLIGITFLSFAMVRVVIQHFLKTIVVQFVFEVIG